MDQDILPARQTEQSPFRTFAWAEAMGFGFGELKLSPQAFWQMTPREFLAALQWFRGSLAMPGTSRDIFEALQQRYPDQQEKRPQK